MRRLRGLGSFTAFGASERFVGGAMGPLAVGGIKSAEEGKHLRIGLHFV